MDTRKLLEEALQLPPEARAAIAGSLLESLDQDVDDDAAERWDEEIAKRVRELTSGEVTPIPWSEARRIIAGT
ncbi:MAG TPA: addiction module protein [Planctomycetota bacterium]